MLLSWLHAWARSVERRPRLWLAALTLGLLLAGTHLLPLLDRDEPRFATATREMLGRGDFVVPTFNGEERFDKPVLIYWLMMPFYALFGASELPARLPGILSTVGLVLLVHGWARAWYGPRAGWWAGFGLATCLQVLIHGRLALADMPLILCLAVTQRGLWELISTRHERYPWGWWAAVWVGAGIGFLAKGPLSLAVPAVTLLLYKALRWREPLPWGQLKPLLGLGAFLLCLAPWGVPALLLTEGRFWQIGMGKHVLERGLEPWGGRSAVPLVYYLLTAPLSLAPWFALLGGLAVWLRQTWGTRAAFLVAWMASLYLIFCFYQTQLMHYVLPAFPAVFLLMGGMLGQSHGALDKLWRHPLAVGWWWGGLALYGLLGGAVFALAALSRPDDLIAQAAIVPLKTLVTAMGAVVLLLAALAWSVRARRHFVTGCVLLALACAFLTAGRAGREINPAAGLPAAVPTLLADRDVELVAVGYREGSLTFYGGRPWTLVPNLDEPGRHDDTDLAALRRVLDRPGPKLIVWMISEIRTEDLLGRSILDPDSVEVRQRDAGVRELIEEYRARPGAATPVVTYQGFNPGRARWCKLGVTLLRR